MSLLRKLKDDSNLSTSNEISTSNIIIYHIQQQQNIKVNVNIPSNSQSRLHNQQTFSFLTFSKMIIFLQKITNIQITKLNYKIRFHKGKNL